MMNCIATGSRRFAGMMLFANAVRVVVNSAGQDFELRAETLDEDVLTPTKPIRLGLRVTAPVTALQFKLTITPELN